MRSPVFSIVLVAALILWMLLPGSALGQSTQCLVTGRTIDSESGQPIGSVRVLWTNTSNGTSGTASGAPDGHYYVTQLSPGIYRLRVSADNYQAQEIEELELRVAARVELNFKLRPLHDVWEKGEYRSVFLPGSRVVLDLFGPDLDSTRSASLERVLPQTGSLQATISEVLDPGLIRDLPLAGRDVYSALVLLPGVASEGGTARGLGLSVNGQRPSSSNFFLDGLGFNNYLSTGPVAAMAPEAIQEYRISITGYSAEYGGTTGFIANAVTRSGATGYHGEVYTYVQNEALNADEFQRNLAGFARPYRKVFQPGFQAGGPIWKKWPLFFSSAFERRRERSEGTTGQYKLPTATFAASTPASSLANTLVSKYPSPASGITGPLTVTLPLASTVSFDRTLAVERIDYQTPGGRHRFSGHVVTDRDSQPDFIWSPFQNLNTRLSEDVTTGAVTYIFSIAPGLFNEAKFGVGTDDLHWSRAHPEIPNLISFDGTVLPSNPGLYSYKNATTSWHFLDNLAWTKGRHLFTFGGGLQWRHLNGELTPQDDGEIDFANLNSFAAATPALLRASGNYSALPSVVRPQNDRDDRVREFSFFAQDTFRLSPRLTLNYGLRYENFGSPTNTGANKDTLIQLGQGATIAARLASAALKTPASGDQVLFHGDAKNLEPRLGISYDLFGTGNTVLRGSWGIFHDRLFDNLWETVRINNVSFLQFQPANSGAINYLVPLNTLLAQSQLIGATQPRVTLFDPNLPNGRSYSYFAGARQRLGPRVSLEVNTLGAMGRDLIATDLVNRTLNPTDVIINSKLPPNIRYRGAQGKSDYHALTAALTYRTSRAQFHMNYTWSHSIDNQSEPLESDLFDFRSAQPSSGAAPPVGFSRQFDPNADRGNSDFDQRQNLVFYSVWDISPPRTATKWNALLRNWGFSQLAAFRTGFPYSVYGSAGRVNIVNPNVMLDATVPVAGGQILLDRAALADPARGQIGNSGRNAFRGPGVYNVDISLRRSFALPWLGESGRLVLRADAFNLLNHANLGNPDNFFSPFNPTFGVSNYGRKGIRSGFPAEAPLNETPRQIQLAFRLEF